MRHVSKPSGSVQHGTLWLCPAKEVVGDRRMRHVWAGNHVVQRCLQKLDSNGYQFIYDAIAENCRGGPGAGGARRDSMGER